MLLELNGRVLEEYNTILAYDLLEDRYEYDLEDFETSLPSLTKPEALGLYSLVNLNLEGSIVVSFAPKGGAL